jgi:hypothetical protein
MKEELREIFNNINDWLKFAEAKNFGLISLIVASVFGFTQMSLKHDYIVQCIGAYIFLPLSILGCLSCLTSLMPILSKIEQEKNVTGIIDRLSNFINKEGELNNIHFFGHLKDLNETEFESEMLTKYGPGFSSFTEYEKDLVTQILYNSRIANIKYQLFKIGGTLFFLAITMMLIAMFFNGILSVN